MRSVGQTCRQLTNMKNLFYRNPRLLILTLCLIVIWGLSSFQLLPRMEDPEIIQPSLKVI